MRARDGWIGWNDTTRAKHLQRIINNSRFLILPQVQVKNLASHVLALGLRTVSTDWEAAYGMRPYLAETHRRCRTLHWTLLSSSQLD